jgi:hypothetical protein
MKMLIAVIAVMLSSYCAAQRQCDAAQYPGADAGAKINSAEADSNCSSVDATNFTTPTAAITIQALKPLVLGSYTLQVSGNPGINLGHHSCLTGKGRQTTIISTTSPTADVIYTHPGNDWACAVGFTIQASVPRKEGAGLHLKAGHGSFRDILINPVWDGIKLDVPKSSNVNYFDNIYMTGGGDGAAWHCGILNGGVPSGTVSGNFFHNIVITVDPTKFSDAMMCIQDGSDGISISDSQFVTGHGDSVPLHVERIHGGNPPDLIKCSNCYFEGGVTANGVVIDSALSFDCVSCYVGSSLNGVVLHGGTGFSWIGGQVVNNQQYGVHVLAGAIDTIFSNARIGDNSLSLNEGYDDIKIEADVKNFQIIGNIFAPWVRTTILPGWNVNIDGGKSSNYYVLNNIMPGSAVKGSVRDNGAATAKKEVQR